MRDRDLEETYQAIGVSFDDAVEGIAEAIDDEDDDEVEGLLLADEDEVGAYIQKKAGASREAAQAVARKIAKANAALEKAYATVGATRLVAAEQRPNSSVTLYATDRGTPCTGGQVYDLRPRVNGTRQATPFKFTRTMTFFGVRTDPVDCAQRFCIVGGSLGFSDDRAKAYPQDVSLTQFRTELVTKDTPLASLIGKSFGDDTEFTCSIYLDAPAATQVGFYGITLLYFERQCSTGRIFMPGVGELDFRGLTRELLSAAKRRRSLAPKARPRLRLFK
ncbi:hypothetical protein [Sorangium sp. So ce1099]|uniref:hypothetical protein n=1 Tax=Sorangium sp. So ce1099 TaxID=3133331 RepID=UPI003F60765B